MTKIESARCCIISPKYETGGEKRLVFLHLFLCLMFFLLKKPDYGKMPQANSVLTFVSSNFHFQKAIIILCDFL